MIDYGNTVTLNTYAGGILCMNFQKDRTKEQTKDVTKDKDNSEDHKHKKINFSAECVAKVYM